MPRKFEKKLFFDRETTQLLHEYGFIVIDYHNTNMKRVANALHPAVMLLGEAVSRSALVDRNNILREWEDNLWMSLDDALGLYVSACCDTAQYERGIDACSFVESTGLLTRYFFARLRAMLYASSGDSVMAESQLKSFADDHQNDPLYYTALGDSFFVWVPLREWQDLERAEHYYYQGYDRGLADEKKSGGRLLLGRLGAVCIQRLRREKIKELIDYVIEHEIGSEDVVWQMVEDVYIKGNESRVLSALQTAVMKHECTAPNRDDRLQLLIGTYNLLPLRDRDGFSPFEMVEYFPMGPHEKRIKEEMVTAVETAFRSIPEINMGDARWSELFSRSQVEFLEQKDGVTGKKRRTVIDREKGSIRTAFEKGKLIWKGFLKYRVDHS